jgi:hypothetical protein
MRKST